ESEKSFGRAIELDPSSSAAHNEFAAFLLRPLGRVDEALYQLRIAEKNDPLSSQIRSNIAVLTSARRYEEAARYGNKLPRDHPRRNRCLGRALLGQGRTEEAIRILVNPQTGADRASLGYAYARSGRREEAEKLASNLSPRPLQQALIFAGL